MNLLETAEMHKQEALTIKEASEIKSLQHMADYHKTMIAISEELNDQVGIERNQADLTNCLISLGLVEATEPNDNALVESYTVSDDGRYVITAHAVVGSVQERPEISHVIADQEKARNLGLHVTDEPGKYGKTVHMTVTDRKTGDISHHSVYQSDISNGKPSFYVRGIGSVRPHDEVHRGILIKNMAANLHEEVIIEDNSAYDAWKNEIEQTHPQHRGTVRYIGFNDPTHGACVNAHVPGADKSLGVYTLSKNQGQVLKEEELVEAEDTDSSDYRVTQAGHKTRAKHARHKSESDANKEDPKKHEESFQMEEGWGADRQAEEKARHNANWDALIAKHSGNEEIVGHLNTIRQQNWKPEYAEGEATKRMNKVEESLQKKMVNALLEDDINTLKSLGTTLLDIKRHQRLESMKQGISK